MSQPSRQADPSRKSEVQLKYSQEEEKSRRTSSKALKTGRSGSEIGGRSAISAPWDMNENEGDTDASRVDDEDDETIQAHKATRNIVRIESQLLQQRQDEEKDARKMRQAKAEKELAAAREVKQKEAERQRELVRKQAEMDRERIQRELEEKMRLKEAEIQRQLEEEAQRQKDEEARAAQEIVR